MTGTLALAVLLLLGRPAGAVTIELVTVGNAGNMDTTGTNPAGLGAVPYDYQMGKYDVTIGQYCAFLNAVAKTDPYGLYNANMYADLNVAGIYRSGVSGAYTYHVIGPYGTRQVPQATAANRPITYVSWFDAARFANWLANGQPIGIQNGTTTEQGVYALNGARSGTAPARSTNARFFIPTQNEWFKAAYFSPTLNSGSGGFWTHGMQNHQAPDNILGGIGANFVNGGVYAVTRSNRELLEQNYLTDVGAYPVPSYYGTFDQGGNVNQWTDGPGVKLTLRGGCWRDDTATAISNQAKVLDFTASEYPTYGFRIAASFDLRSSPTPDPSPTEIILPVPAGMAFTQGQCGYAALSGTLPVWKVDGGAVNLDQANALAADMTVRQGTMLLSHASALVSSKLSVMEGGTAQVAPYLVAAVAGLNLSGTGLVDVTNGGLTVASGLSPASLVASLIEGRNGGTWDGTSGITSSVTAAQVAASETRAVGWLDNGDGSLTVAYAAQGDTNLDWVVDILDVASFVVSGRYGTSKPASWAEGDFNYDGIVDIQDVANFASTGLYGGENYNTPLNAVAVPEPSGMSLAIMATTIASLVARRRRCLLA